MANEAILGSYTPEEVTVVISVGGQVHNVTGYAEGTFITATRNIPPAEAFQGSDNQGGRVKRRNTSRRVTLSLMQFTASNNFMEAWQAADEEASRNEFIGSVMIKDNSGTTLLHSNQAFIEVSPDIVFSNTAEQRDWTIFLFNATGKIGGNTLIDESTAAAIEGLGGQVDARWRL
jgi:hypothetical protein